MDYADVGYLFYPHKDRSHSGYVFAWCGATMAFSETNITSHLFELFWNFGHYMKQVANAYG